MSQSKNSKSGSRKSVVILGGGVTGLSSAYRLSQNGNYDVHVIDRESTVGGVCRSFTEGEFTLDYGPHKFYSLIDGIVDELKTIMGPDLLEREKTQMLYLGGKYYNYPLKMSEMILRFPPTKTARALASFGTQMVQNKLHPHRAVTYEEFLVERFGRELYETIFEPMSRKMFGEPAELDRKLAEVRISAPGLIAVIKQALLGSKVDRTMSAPTFHYPKFGYGMIPQRLKEMSEKNGAKYHLSSKLLNLETKGGQVTGVTFENSAGETQKIKADHIIYTIPLSTLPDLIGDLPTEIRRACKFVAYRHTIIYYYLLRSQPVLPAMWVFCPESKFRFGRLSEMVKFSPYTAPAGHTALMVDFTCEENDPEWSMDDADLGRSIEQQLVPFNLLTGDTVIKRFSKRFRSFYPVYSVGYDQHLKSIRGLENLFDNMFFIGRLGDFNYNNADQCMDMGFKAADHIEQSGATTQGWQDVRTNRFERYKIVD